MAVQSLNEISNSVVNRCSSGIPDLDKIFGKTVVGGFAQYGFPMGYITYLSGAPGVGKTRVGIKIAKNINAKGMRILVFQGEVRPSEFKQWTGTNVENPDNFFVSDDRDLNVMIDDIATNKPHFVIIDSANMIKGFAGQEDCREIFESLKKVVAEVGCHLLMIGHLTKDGKTKGSADVEHLVDVVCKLKHFPEAEFISGYTKSQKAQIVSAMGNAIIWEIVKNRYGPAGGWVLFKHNDNGVEFEGSSIQFKIMTSVTPKVVIMENPKKVVRTGGFLSWLGR